MSREEELINVYEEFMREALYRIEDEETRNIIVSYFTDLSKEINELKKAINKKGGST